MNVLYNCTVCKYLQSDIHNRACSVQKLYDHGPTQDIFYSGASSLEEVALTLLGQPPEKTLSLPKANFTFQGFPGQTNDFIWDPDFTLLFLTPPDDSSTQVGPSPGDPIPFPNGNPTASGNGVVSPAPPGPPLGLAGGAIAGIIVGALLGVAVLFFLLAVTIKPLTRIVFPYSRIEFWCCCNEPDETAIALESYQ